MSALSLLDRLSIIVGDAFVAQGFAYVRGRVVMSARADLAQFQCNGALACAKEAKKNPMDIAEQLVQILQNNPIFAKIEAVKPGFLNMDVTDDALAQHLQTMAADENFGAYRAKEPLRVMVDYVGANVAKPLHVGHLRSSVIGDALVRMFKTAGHYVISDVHLGDWGLQMGMLICEVEQRGITHPVTLAELENLYPQAAASCKADPARMEAARIATQALQSGNVAYRALWRGFVDVSVASIRENLDRLDIHPDLWLGESDVQKLILPMVKELQAQGIVETSDAALIIRVDHEEDKSEIPPLILVKSDGAALYGTTDLATIKDRKQHDLDLVLYVVDQRQHLHFEQVFRAAHKSGLLAHGAANSGGTQVEHIGFGTVNGKDGKPFKTREGGVMKLKDLIDLCVEAAGGVESIGIAALKFADLSSQRISGYVFDVERFVSTEGKTGPYLQYACVRVQSMMEKSEVKPGIISLGTPEERALALVLVRFPNAMQAALTEREPSVLCEYAYELSQTFSRFYTNCPIAKAQDPQIAAARMGLSRLVHGQLMLCLHMLGIRVPKRM